MMDELVVVIVAGTLWSVIPPSLCLSCSIERNHNDGTIIYRKEVRRKKKGRSLDCYYKAFRLYNKVESDLGGLDSMMDAPFDLFFLSKKSKIKKKEWYLTQSESHVHIDLFSLDFLWAVSHLGREKTKVEEEHDLYFYISSFDLLLLLPRRASNLIQFDDWLFMNVAKDSTLGTGE